MTTPRKTKKVRCWMVKRGKPNHHKWLVLNDPTNYEFMRNTEIKHTITPGHFVPEVKKARKR